MGDNGSGSDITIPSFLMFKQDADLIKAELIENHMVRLEMAWPLPNPDVRVEYELWTTPTDAIGRGFELQFKSAATALGNRAYFTPHMSVYDGIKMGCGSNRTDYDGVNPCSDLCSENGRYCSTDPDGTDGGISGQDVVKESLRRECIWKVYGKDDGIGKEWWEYVTAFHRNCGGATDDGRYDYKHFADPHCIRNAISSAKIDSKKVEECEMESGRLDQDAPNTLFEEQLRFREKSGAVLLPSVFVNTALIRGTIEFATVFKAVCAGFRRGSEPQICSDCAQCTNEYQCVRRGGDCSSKNDNGTTTHVSIPVFVVSMTFVVLLFASVGITQWRRTQDQMRHQVRGIIMGEYIPVVGGKKNIAGLSALDKDGYDDDDDDITSNGME
eukprot:CAMPEP_0194139788 /NCGR_PEP_ID=MMETSP0152-20130528/9393_1 /TAXON_ID=1049557 /ORGANISM="Thalassiothrix antarctica, Strain L6-D1" /LENGTH=384 /DNA_ID=CAMNT_0038837747 /DNA_START=81 /DNA_END=1232 /DNA_ORIENTATION=+